jgi:FkbM family methyltransferase
MGLLGRGLANLLDVRHFGLGVLRRHLRHSNPVFKVRLRDYGRIYLRADSIDLDLARVVLVDGTYDVPWPEPASDRLQRTYRTILAAGRKPVIVNAGGYIGLSALWFAREWPEAEIVSVEPLPANLALLRRNLAGRPHHTIIEAALGSNRGKAAVCEDMEPCAAQIKRARTGIDIITVDDAVASVDGGDAFICNIDIEGFEKDLFAANTDWIDRFALVIIEPHDGTDPGAFLSRNFRREMADRPFDMYARGGALHFVRV